MFRACEADLYFSFQGHGEQVPVYTNFMVLLDLHKVTQYVYGRPTIDQMSNSAVSVRNYQVGATVDHGRSDAESPGWLSDNAI